MLELKADVDEVGIVVLPLLNLLLEIVDLLSDLRDHLLLIGDNAGRRLAEILRGGLRDKRDRDEDHRYDEAPDCEFEHEKSTTHGQDGLREGIPLIKTRLRTDKMG
ncbi:hypothetical protein [Mesorhizobium sp. ANAO-SY3R2]|uniref:hypothetical protein n=1 Tax=Mesorhizobium sp. ANAO-SY3R2 TaxID=3166644 RepID=UPI00366C67CC